MKLTDRKREAIVQAAIELFQTQGFDGTSMDRVSDAAGVSKRTVYNHFPSKEELFAECCRLAWPGGDSLLHVYQPGHPLEDQLTAFVEQKLKRFADEKVLGLTRVALMTMLRSSEWAHELHERLGDLDKDTRVWIEAACDDGTLADCDPEMAALQLDALINGFALWPQVTMRRWKLGTAEQREVAEGIVRMFLARYAKVTAVPPSRSPKSRAKPSKRKS